MAASSGAVWLPRAIAAVTRCAAHGEEERGRKAWRGTEEVKEEAEAEPVVVCPAAPRVSAEEDDNRVWLGGAEAREKALTAFSVPFGGSENDPQEETGVNGCSV